MTAQLQSRNLIIHADDGGLCQSVNRAIINILNNGIATSTSLMVPCHAFGEIAEYFNNNPHFDVGIHFTLTCGYPQQPWGPVAGKAMVPSLVNADGYFWRTVEQVVKNATVTDVETELRAQIERALQAGIKPTHLDTHRGVIFQDFRFLEIYVKLGLEYQIPPMLLKPNQHTLQTARSQGIKLDPEKIASIMELGLPFLDELFMIDDNGIDLDQRREKYKKVISGLPVGVSQIIIHPGYNDDDLNRLTSNGKYRNEDRLVFTEPAMKEWVAEQGIRLIGWREFARMSGFAN